MEQIAPAESVRLANLGAVAAVRTSVNCELLGLSILNTQAAAIFVQLFDAATAGAVTLGTTVPLLEFNVAASVPANPPFPPGGVRFRTGCQIASTTTEGGAAASAAGVFVYALVT